MPYQNMGTFNAPTIGGARAADGAIPANIRMNDAAIASGNAFLISELEKRDTLIRTPLTSFTYPRDIPVDVGGGWVDSASAMSVGYGLTGGSTDGPVHAPGANGIPVVQANLNKDAFKTHVFAVALRIMFVDMQRSQSIGRSLEQMLSDGVRMSYDKHMDANVYRGLETYGTYGLLNQPNAVISSVAATGTGSSTLWKNKTAEQILADINTALTDAWAAAEYDRSAIPNHILLPYEQYMYILTQKVTDLATETIMDFVMRNNVANKEGAGLFIGATAWNKGAGTNGADRMVVYVNDRRFLKVEELVPLARVMTGPNPTEACYDSAYMANMSEVEVFYEQCIRYYDGI